MALGFYQGVKDAQDTELAQQRNDILSRQQRFVERTELQRQAKERFVMTFDSINQLVLSGKDSGADPNKISDTAMKMASTLYPIAEAMGLPRELVDAKVNSALAQPSSQERAIAEAQANAVAEGFKESAKLRAKTKEDLTRLSVGLDLPDPTAFMKNVGFIFDPNTPPDVKQFAMNALNADLNKNNLQISVTPDGGVTVSKGGGASAGGIPKEVMGTRSNIDVGRERRAELENALDTINTIEGLFATNPDLLGALGSVTKLEQTVTGVSKDIASQLPNISESLTSLRNKIGEWGGEDPALADYAEDALLKKDGKSLTSVNSGTVDVLETSLKFTLLNAFTGGRRPLKTEIDEVKELSQLRGFKSLEQLRARLTTIKAIVNRQMAQNQRTLEKQVEGEARTPRGTVSPSKTTPTSSFSNDQELLKALENAKNGILK